MYEFTVSIERTSNLFIGDERRNGELSDQIVYCWKVGWE